MRSLTTTLIWIVSLNVICAQVPLGFSFQTIIRDSEGKVQKNQSTGIQFSILEGSAMGTVVYSETHTITTNEYGVINLTVGTGTVTEGVFADIVWGSNLYFLKTEIDPTGGNTYTISTTSQLMSVPYAMYAMKADTALKVPDSSITNEIQVISISNDTIYLSDGGYVKLPVASEGSILDGSEQGKIPYWNGSSWVALTKGNPGQQLTINENGLPKWTGDAFPSVSTVSTSNISATTVSVSVNITSDGGQSVSSRGVVYATSDNPTLSNSNQVSGSGTGSFSVTVNDLTPNTTYYVRGYATNSVGTGYGSSLNFTTTAPTLPVLSTNAISSITQTSAVAGGVISSDGGSAITARGVVWSTTTNPTISDNKTEDGTGTGNYNSTLTGLIPSTLYYVRSYATNSSGTGYGEELSFTTAALTVPILSTNTVVNITKTSAQSGGMITSDGGSTISVKGVVWSTTTNPTISDNKTEDGTGTGNYNSTLTGLIPSTLYYVRSYATNSVGTAYGNELSFTTAALTVPILSTNTVVNITKTSAQSGGMITSDGGSTISVKGVVWSTTTNPTISDNKTEDGTGTGNYNSTLTGLIPNTLYYVRSYATNSSGTGYGEERSITTAPTTVTDIDGNVYNTVQIGNQVWMKENLKTSRYNTGSAIPYVEDNESWKGLNTGAWSYYDHDENNNAIYGKLYNWYAVLGDSLCPTGWHVPTDAEWTGLTNTLGGLSVAGGKLKEVGTVHWNSPNTGATDEVGFTGLPGGERTRSGSFGWLRVNGFWWSATPDNTTIYDISYYRRLNSGVAWVARFSTDKSDGFSVRCLRD